MSSGEELPESSPHGVNGDPFAHAIQLRELADEPATQSDDAEIPDNVTSIGDARSLRKSPISAESMAAEREAAAKRWEAGSVRDYGDFRFKRKPD